MIQPNLAEIWAYAHKPIACMHTSLHAWVEICAQTVPACSPDSIYTLISLIQPILAEIWASARKYIACMLASLCAQVNYVAKKIQHVFLIP